jgi:hypothetical protein
MICDTINFRGIVMVQFSEGNHKNYAIRKGWIFHRYLDLATEYRELWWSKSDKFFEDCLTDNYQIAREKFYQLRDPNTIEKIIETP